MLTAIALAGVVIALVAASLIYWALDPRDMSTEEWRDLYRRVYKK